MSMSKFTVGMGNTVDCRVVYTQLGGFVVNGVKRIGNLQIKDLYWIPYENIKSNDTPTFSVNDVLSIRGTFTPCSDSSLGVSICAYAIKILKIKILTKHNYQPYVRPITPVPAIQSAQVKPLQVDHTGKTGYMICDKAISMMVIREMNIEIQALKEISVIHNDSYFIPMENQARMVTIGEYISQKFPEFMKGYIALVTL